MRPNNATVVVVGDFDTADVIEKEGTAFGKRKPSKHIPEVRAIEPEQIGERRVRVEKARFYRPDRGGDHTPGRLGSRRLTPLMVAARASLSGAKPLGFGGGCARWVGSPLQSARIDRDRGWRGLLLLLPCTRIRTSSRWRPRPVRAMTTKATSSE